MTKALVVLGVIGVAARTRSRVSRHIVLLAETEYVWLCEVAYVESR